MSKKNASRDVGDEEAHQPLQAILLADSFTQKFKPITLERPKVLLPLVNVPVLDYTLEWLASAGVEEVFVFCCAHAQQVVGYLQASKWQTLANFKVTPIVSHNCMSPGEAFRLIDEKNIMRSDFVLVSGDTVCNMPLERILEEHKKRRLKDKQAVMTMVVKRSKTSPVTRQTRLGNEELMLTICPETKQLLRYDQDKDVSDPKSRYVALDTYMFQDWSAVQLRTDLQDCFVDICAPEVLMLFTDNFDYQHPRRDFVKGLLSDEVMGNKIYTYEVNHDYASRVDNLRSYAVVSSDIIHRWTYPLVVDNKFADKANSVKVSRGNVYKDEGLSLARTAVIGSDTVLGAHSSVGDKSVISNTVIGRNCSIGNNVKIEGSYLWDNVRIEDNVSIASALLCDGVVVKAGAILEPGVVLSFKVEIGAGFTVPAYSKLSLLPQPDEEDSGDEELEYDQAGIGHKQSPPKLSRLGSPSPAGTPVSYKDSEVGVGGKGCRWVVREGSEEDIWRQAIAPIPRKKLEQLARALQQEEADETVADVGASKALDEETDSEEEDNLDKEFAKEIADTYRRGVVEKHKHDNVVLEINGLKLAYNKTFADCASSVFRTMLVMAQETKPTSAKGLLSAFNNLLTQWGTLLGRFLPSVEEEVEILLTLEEACVEEASAFSPLFKEVASLLYNEDVISEDGFFQWEKEKEFAEDADRKFLNQSAEFLRWLREAEEEDSEEEEEEEEEESSEEETRPLPKASAPVKAETPSEQKETPREIPSQPRSPVPKQLPAVIALPSLDIPEAEEPQPPAGKRPQSKPMDTPKTPPRSARSSFVENRVGPAQKESASAEEEKQEEKSESFKYEPGLGDDSDQDRADTRRDEHDEDGLDGSQSPPDHASVPSELPSPSIDFEHDDKYLKATPKRTKEGPMASDERESGQIGD